MLRPLLALAAMSLPFSGALAAAKVGAPAPAFTLKDESGKEHKLADYKGKTVVLEWTNPNCPYVQTHYEKKTMKDLAGKFGGKDVVWLAVDSGHAATAKDEAEFKKKHAVSYPTLLDTDGKVGHAYDATNTPHMFVVDKEGVLRYAGAIDDDPTDSNPKRKNYVDGALTAMAAGKAPDPAETKAYGCSVKYKK